MAHDGSPLPDTALLPDLLGLTAAALPEVEALFDRAREALRGMVTVGGKVSAAALVEHQFAAHSLSWLATYVAVSYTHLDVYKRQVKMPRVICATSISITRLKAAWVA